MKMIKHTNNYFYHKAHEARRKVTNQALRYKVDGLNIERLFKFKKNDCAFSRNGSHSRQFSENTCPFFKKVLDQI
jgi:hypothetical protein